MELNHLGLPVRNAQTSKRFYCEYFDFDSSSAQQYEDGTVMIRNAHGFDLALHEERGDLGSIPEFLHFGFRQHEPTAVRSLLDRLTLDGVQIVDRCEEWGHVSFKCLDPDGHRIEIYWERPG
ncbi:VOC family protein [Streptomyces sp. NPDC002262]|uniref:VOC family protein n=1 Tax=Streptomyces sp. NPDC002262 TaxID=3154414 RepID=UPI0033171D25